MITVTGKQARADRMAHAFRPGMGYVQVGKLNIPKQPKAPASTAEPSVPAQNNSVHFLNPPMGAKPMQMRWHPKEKEWSPMIISLGKRTGFTSQYLAAHGWFYLGPAPATQD